MSLIVFERALGYPLARFSCLALLIITTSTPATSREQFFADPNRLNDFTASLPTHGSIGSFQYEVIQGMAVFEGDILLGRVNQYGLIPNQLQGRGLGRSDAFGRWPDGIVPYLEPESNSPIQQRNIRQAMDHWMQKTRISFVARTAQNADQYPHYLRFENSNSCASYVGMQGNQQSIMVSDACSMGSIVHEIGHALGLYHEHTRPDRDNYVQIDWNQITPDKEINFNILDAGVENHGTYDYGSIMHYGEYFFSETQKRTIIAPEGIVIGQRDALSAIDAQSIDRMYATDLAVTEPIVTQTDEGLELDISINNIGALGAQQLELIARVADDSVWTGMSRDSGWQCSTYGPELRCQRPTLPEQSESRFRLQVDPKSGDRDDIRLLLASRTLDLDLSNNAINDDGTLIPTQAQTDQSNNDLNVSTGDTGEVTPSLMEPTVAAAQSGNENNTVASAAGSDNGSLFVMALATLGLVRLRRRSCGTMLLSLTDHQHDSTTRSDHHGLRRRGFR